MRLKSKLCLEKVLLNPRLLTAGFSENHVVSCAHILGVDFTACLVATDRPFQDIEIQEAKRRSDRIALLPLGSPAKAFLVAATLAAVWGAWLTTLPTKKIAIPVSRKWQGEKSDVQEAFDFWRGGVEPPVPLAWEPLSAAELQEQAKRQHGKASGCDGWQGSEVSSWPSHAFVILAELVERWFARGEKCPAMFVTKVKLQGERA